jgi:hypothetical protein
MSLAIEVLISQIVERCQLIFCYGPFSENLIPKKVIVSQIEDSREVHDTYTESVAFNAEVDGGLIPTSTSPSSGTELNYQLCIPILVQAKDIKYSKRVSLGNDLVEYWITLVLHIGPINIELWDNRILSFLDHCEIPISLEIVLATVIRQLGCPIKWILITVHHGLIFPQGEVSRSMRVYS